MTCPIVPGEVPNTLSKSLNKSLKCRASRMGTGRKTIEKFGGTYPIFVDSCWQNFNRGCGLTRARSSCIHFIRRFIFFGDMMGDIERWRLDGDSEANWSGGNREWKMEGRRKKAVPETFLTGTSQNH
ncbi:hypothetical protein B0H14DRAFT_2571173 [Mycena olivaceomarginata]|nr:hypothetical protein B0H14DRAFT_2571173 [Mycena olivaceomarginata]